MNAQEARTVGVLHLVCPYCDNLEALRDACMYCGGYGYVPGPRLYEGDSLAKSGMFRTTGEALRAFGGYAIFGILVGVPAAFLLLRALGIIQ